MVQTAFCRLVACSVSEIKCYRCFTSDLGSQIIRLYNYSLLSMLFADTHVIGLICCQHIVVSGIISIRAALWDWGIRGFLVVGAEIDYVKVSATNKGHNMTANPCSWVQGSVHLEEESRVAARVACMVAAVAVNPETVARQLSAERLAPQKCLWGEGRSNNLDHLELDLTQCKESFALDLHRQSVHPHHFEQDGQRLISSSKAAFLRLDAKLQSLRAESLCETAVRDLSEHEAEQRLDVMGWEEFGSTNFSRDLLRKSQQLLAGPTSRPRAEAVTDEDLEAFVLSAA